MTTDTYKSLEELKAANLPRPRAADIFNVEGDDTNNVMAAIQAYLDGFTVGADCPRCTEPEDRGNSAMVNMLLGRGFDWGLAYGEMACRCCGYPARGQHKIILSEDGEDSVRFPMILPYHPDTLSDNA